MAEQQGSALAARAQAQARTEIAIKDSVGPVSLENGMLIPRSDADVFRIADAMFKGGINREGLKTPQQIAIAIFKGLSLGFDVMQSCDTIAVINGKPAIYGDGALALIRSKGVLGEFKETLSGSGDEAGYTCFAKRKDTGEERVQRFTVADAKAAKLLPCTNEFGPWKKYPTRMLMWRARAWCLRDLFGDVLMGLAFVEEAIDAVDQMMTMIPGDPMAEGAHKLPTRGRVVIDAVLPAAKGGSVPESSPTAGVKPDVAGAEGAGTVNAGSSKEGGASSPAAASASPSSSPSEVAQKLQKERAVKAPAKAKPVSDPVVDDPAALQGFIDDVIDKWAARADVKGAVAQDEVSRYCRLALKIENGIEGITVNQCITLLDAMDDPEFKFAAYKNPS